MDHMQALQQLAGSINKLAAMTGAHTFVKGDDFVGFRFKAKATNGANYCRITLAADDTYTVRFCYLRGVTVKEKGGEAGLYAEMLTEYFTEETGLYLSL